MHTVTSLYITTVITPNNMNQIHSGDLMDQLLHNDEKHLFRCHIVHILAVRGADQLDWSYMATSPSRSLV